MILRALSIVAIGVLKTLLEMNIVSGLKSLKGVSCDRDRLQKALKDSDRTMESILAMVVTLDDPSLPPEKQIFLFNEDSIIQGQKVKKVV